VLTYYSMGRMLCQPLFLCGGVVGCRHRDMTKERSAERIADR
jgi:hypothetical protein